MPNVARLGDPTQTATCPPGHDKNPWVGPGVLNSASSDVFIENIPIVRLGDTVALGDPLHPQGSVVAGSPDVFANYIPVARLGDTTVNGAGWISPIAVGASTVNANS